MYTWFYGFSEEPFKVNPDPNFFYPSQTHQQILDFITQGIREKEGLIPVLGDLGSGKTTLIQYLLNTIDKKVKAVATFHPHETFEDLLEDILRQLGVPAVPHDKVSQVRQLNDYLHSLAPDETLALLIDEAQDLSPAVMEDLRFLPTPETLRDGKLQIILAGQPELRAKLDSAGLREPKQGRGVIGQLRPLKEEECRLYIAHRLQRVDSDVSEVITPGALERICRYANGNPRTINILCDNSFLVGYGLSRRKVDAAIVAEVLEDLDFIGSGELGERKPEEVRRVKTLSARGRSDLFRKVSYSLLALGGVGVLILLGRIYLKEPEEALTAKFPIQPPALLEKGIFPRDEARPKAAAKAAAQPEKIRQSPISDLPSEAAKPTPAPLALPPGEPRARVETRVKKTVPVKGGDSLYDLAAQNYHVANTSVVDQILESNPEISNPNKVLASLQVRLPDITEGSLTIADGDGTYHIRLGTFLKAEYSTFLKGEPALRGKQIEIVPRRLATGETWYRAMAGKFSTREEGVQVVRELRAKGLSPYFAGFQKRK